MEPQGVPRGERRRPVCLSEPAGSIPHATLRRAGPVKDLEAALNTEMGNMRAKLSLGEHRRENINADYRGNHCVQLGFQLC
jgi:hypothetical protein